MARERGKKAAVLSSMTLSGMESTLAIKAAITTRVFETHVEEVLMPDEYGQI